LIILIYDRTDHLYSFLQGFNKYAIPLTTEVKSEALELDKYQASWIKDVLQSYYKQTLAPYDVHIILPCDSVVNYVASIYDPIVQEIPEDFEIKEFSHGQDRIYRVSP